MPDYLKKRVEKWDNFAFWKNVLVKERATFSTILAIVFLLIFGQVLSPGFSSLLNLGNLLAFAAVLLCAAVGQTFVVIAGGEGIDLSVGSMMSMGALVGAMLIRGQNVLLPEAIIVLAILGAIIGAINGISIYSIGLPPLVMTLGMATVVDGLVLAVTKGQPSGQVPPILETLGIGNLIPLFHWLFIFGVAVVVLMELVLRKTSFGSNLFLVGTNRFAALMNGIKVRRTVVLAYIFGGMAGTLAGLILLSSVGSAQMQLGSEYTLTSIAAVALGGTALAGGKGSFMGTALGAMLMVVVMNVLIAVKMSPGVRETMQGLVLLVILAFYSRQAKLRN